MDCTQEENKRNHNARPWPLRVWRFYADGFREMTSTGRLLWLIILIKLFVFFVVIKLFFFPNILERDYSSDSERAAAVRISLTDRQ